MTKLSGKIFKQILLAIHEKFSELIKTSLKRDINSINEQTVLAGVVFFWESSCSFEIISLASGTKSVGRKNLSLLGNLIADSHAEVLARRAFKRFIIDNLYNDKYFFRNQSGKIQQRDFKVIFYSSQTPCGQASIARTCIAEESCNEKKIDGSAASAEQSNATMEQQGSQTNEEQILLLEQKQQQLILQSTGAKYYDFVFDEKYDPSKDAQDNQLRVKPGRSDLPRDARSISLSCSDKILFWNILGLQGSLLFQQLAAPIYIDYLFIEGEGSSKSNMEEFKQGIKHGLFLEERLDGEFTKKQIKQRLFQNEEQEDDGMHEDKEKARLMGISKKIAKKHVSAFKITKPKVIVTKKIFFTLNRSLVERKPKYLDQHIVYVTSAVIAGEKRNNVVEVLNGATGLKWGMGAKGAEVPKNYPLFSKYCMIQAFNEHKKISQVDQYTYETKESLTVTQGHLEGLNQEQKQLSQDAQELAAKSYGEQKQQASEYHTVKSQIEGLFRTQSLVEKSYLEKFMLQNNNAKKIM